MQIIRELRVEQQIMEQQLNLAWKHLCACEARLDPYDAQTDLRPPEFPTVQRARDQDLDLIPPSDLSPSDQLDWFQTKLQEVT